jgi:hypothetical protein
MAKKLWGDYRESSFIPGPSEAMVYFGAQVGFDPSREGTTPLLQYDRLPPAECPDCGGEGVWVASVPIVVIDPATCEYPGQVEYLYRPGKIRPGSMGYCVRCTRWGRDWGRIVKLWAELDCGGTLAPVAIDPETGDDVPIGQVA